MSTSHLHQLADSLIRDAEEIDLAIKQEQTPEALLDRAGAAAIHAGRQLLLAVDAGVDVLNLAGRDAPEIVLDKSNPEAVLGWWCASGAVD